MDFLRFPFRKRQVPARRRCILHIGSPKTATSSIQTMLKTNRRRFLKHGILVPESGQGESGAHRALAYALAGVPLDPNADVEQDFLREVRDSAADCVLLSSEFMWPLLGVPAQGRRLLECLRSLDLDIALLLYVRNQPQYLNSSYVQQVKTFHCADEFSGFAGRARRKESKYAYSQWIDFSAKHGVGLVARPFSEPVRTSGVTQDFLSTIGLSSSDGFDVAVERNVSDGPFSVEVARTVLRRIGGPKKLARPQLDKCRSVVRSELGRRRIDDGRYCGLTTSLAAEIEQQYDEDNSRFAQFAWGKPWHAIFEFDLNQSFEPNDYSMTGIPADRRLYLAETLESLETRIAAVTGHPAAL